MVPTCLPSLTREERLGAVLDHRYAALPGQRHDAAHLAGVSEEMGHHDHAGPVAETVADRLGGHIAGAGINVGKDRDGALVEDWRERTHVGDRGGDDLVPGLRIDRRDSRVQGRRAGAAGMGVAHPMQLRGAGLELLHEAALGARERAALDMALWRHATSSAPSVRPDAS